jgi:hypothetical protein
MLHALSGCTASRSLQSHGRASIMICSWLHSVHHDVHQCSVRSCHVLTVYASTDFLRGCADQIGAPCCNLLLLRGWQL